VLTSDGSRGTLAIWVAAATFGGIVLLHLGGCGDRAGPGTPVRIERSPDTAVTGAASGAGRESVGIYVHVAGAVRRPGLLRLPPGSRVAAALDRAGGPQRRADLAGVNLAAKLEDGQQVIVPVRGAATAGGAAAGSGAAGSAATGAAAPPGSAGVPKLSLGVATVEQLDQLDGIGPTLAQRIVEYRTEHGGFRSVDELREVEGIGEKRFATLRGALQP
jgi:competence protein ComEA